MSREADDLELKENELLRRLIHLRAIMCNVPDWSGLTNLFVVLELQGSERSFNKILNIARNLVGAPAVSKIGLCASADTESRE